MAREATPRFNRRPATILAGRDPVRCAVWAGALVLVSLEVALRSESIWRAAGGTAMPFLTLAAIIAAAAFAERLGAFALLARMMIPATSPTAASVAAVLVFTAMLSGLVNLDVAVVVAMPMALMVAARRSVSAGWLAGAGAVTANATSFLLPTSNVTTLLVLSASGSRRSYVGDSWVAWIFVTTLTVGVLSLVVSRRVGEGTPRATGDGPRLGAVLDLVPMFLAASA